MTEKLPGVTDTERAIAELYNAWVSVGNVLEGLQPGLTKPLPEGDRNELDAMKIQWLAGQISRGLA